MITVKDDHQIIIGFDNRKEFLANHIGEIHNFTRELAKQPTLPVCLSSSKNKKDALSGEFHLRISAFTYQLHCIEFIITSVFAKCNM